MFGVNLHRGAFPYRVGTSVDVTTSAASTRANRSSGPLLAVAWLLLWLASGACVGSGVGIPDAAGVSGEVPQSFEEIQLVIFDPSCVPCHRGGAAPKGLSLEPGRSHSLLVGVPSTEVPELLRVAPGSANDSYLVAKLAPFDSRRIGGRMPRNGPPYLNDAQLRAIKRWIDDGAAVDWVDTGDQIDAGIADAAPPYDAVSIPDASAPDAE